jgi:hypothetical protein
MPARIEIAEFSAEHLEAATHCTTNWRTSNLEASRVWPRLGFRRTHLRLRRDIDPLLGGEG